MNIKPEQFYTYKSLFSVRRAQTTSFGNHILKAGQVPWPGAKVWRDTEITTGDEANRIGRMLKTGSVSLALVSLCCAIYFYYSFDEFVFIIKKIIVFTKGIF